MNFASFGIPPDEISSRLSISITIVLTLIALKLALSPTTPINGSVNWQDSYLNIGVPFTSILMTLFASNRLENWLDICDHRVFAVFICTWLLYNIRFSFIAYRKFYSFDSSIYPELVTSTSSDLSPYHKVARKKIP